MAKKRKDEDISGLSMDELTTRINDEVEKEYGEDVMVDGASVLSAPIVRVSVSPALDIILSGGIEEGSWVGISGPPKTGKTTLAFSIAANCQKPEYGSRPVYYIKAEGRLSVTHLKGIQGLDTSPNRFKVVKSRKGRILVAENFLDITSNILKTVPGAVVIIDSASALCGEAEMNSKMGDQAIAPGHKMFSKFIRTNAQVVPVNQCIVLVITHVLANIGRPGTSERVARAAQYQYDYMLRSISKTAWMAGDRQIGLAINWACNTSKSGPPGMKIESHLRFGVGVDRLYEVVTLGVASGLIRAAGVWFYLDFLSKLGHQEIPKAQGMENLYRLIGQNPEWAKCLEQEMLSLSGALAGSAGDE